MKRCKTPELDKMLAVKEKSQTIGEFLQWLAGQEFEICECGKILDNYDEKMDGLLPVRKSTEQLLAEFFEIDLNKCEQERQQILADLRSDGG